MGWKRLFCVTLAVMAVGTGCKKERPPAASRPDGRGLSRTELGAAAWNGDLEAVRTLLTMRGCQ